MGILNPASVAVIGASADEKKLGHFLLKNLLTQGFSGEVHPVNPKGGEILGKQAFTSVGEIPGPVELAVIVTPTPTVVPLAEECAKKGVKTLVVITAGFGETGTEEGKKQEASLLKIVERAKMQLIGPNCLGYLRPSIGLNASFTEDLPDAGNIALLSQSGAVAVAIMDASKDLGLGFSLIVSMGNKTAMDECDFLEICEGDEETKVIGMYLESVKDGERFLTIARRIAKTKPIVLIKSGVSQRGKHAVSSHTGALAGSDAAIDAACRDTGILRASSSGEFLDMLRTLAHQPPLLSPNIVVITNAGGPGILATDAAEREGLVLAPLTPKLKEALKQGLPPAASAENPIDVLGDALEDRYAAAISACAKDKGVDGIIVVLTPQIMTPAKAVAGILLEAQKKHRLIPIVTSFMGGDHVRDAVRTLQGGGIPNFPSPEAAIHAMRALLKTNGARKPKVIMKRSGTANDAEKLLKKVNGLVSETTTEKLFSLYRLPIPKQAVATNEADAVRLAKEIDYPVIAKVSSPAIVHKTDIGGVRANLQNEREVKAAFKEILKNAKKHAPNANVNGVLIQQFLPAGNEFIVGSLRDPTFGPLIMVGLGGIYTELFGDRTFRIAPVSEEEAYGMLQELKSWKILLGMRGKPQSDIASLAKLIAATSRLVADCPRIRELDLNPVRVDSSKVTVLDAKVIVD
ncbi:MAG: acetate--CoA ligase family protein [Candidatus Peregrinibacteria bacterium]|nr:acetate--CoA ligase family protein [Candidatus Peregrinibacteria bacterium]